MIPNIHLSKAEIAALLSPVFEYFGDICSSIEVVEYGLDEVALSKLSQQAKQLALVTDQALFKLKTETPTNGYTDAPRKLTLDEVMAMQAAERGIEPMPLEVDLLIQRIEQGGFSGKFLADAFLCSYRPLWFNHSLFEVSKLDIDAFRLFHEIIHIRHVPGWSDAELFEVEKRVRDAMGEGEKQRKRAAKLNISKAKSGLEGQGGAA